MAAVGAGDRDLAGKTDADGDDAVAAAAVGDIERLDRGAQVLGKMMPAVCRGVRQDDRELFPAVARGDVAWPSRHTAEQVAQPLQAFIALLVAVAIVVALEMIHVDKQQRERQSVACASRQLARQRFVERATIGEPGETVGPPQLTH